MSGHASLSLKPRAPLSLSLIVGALHAFAAVAILLSVPASWSWLAMLPVLVSSVAMFTRERPGTLAFGADGALWLEFPDGGLAGTVGARRYVSRYLVILPWRHPAGHCLHLVLVPDMFEPDAFRRIRLWALWGRVGNAAPEPAVDFGAN